MHNSSCPITINYRPHFPNFINIFLLKIMLTPSIRLLIIFLLADCLNNLIKVKLAYMCLVWVLGIGKEGLEIFIMDISVDTIKDCMYNYFL